MNFLNENSPASEPVKSNKGAARIAITIALLFLIASAGVAYYYYKQWNDLKTNPAKVSDSENKSLVEKVGKIILLPTGEDPTIATVTEPDKLKGQAFFVNAKVGDKVLVYAKAKTAYLYDPDANKVLNVSPINDTPPATDTTVSGSETTNDTTKK